MIPRYVISTPNRDLNILAQRRLFELGLKWHSGDITVKNLYQTCLVLDMQDKSFTAGSFISLSAVRSPYNYKIIEFGYLYSQRFINETL